jgi:retron-type reverse transcriptase
MTETQSSQDVSTRLERIARLAKEKPGVSLLTLAHHIDVNWLREAYRRTRKDGAPGVDGQGAEQYAERLEDNLQSLLDRAKSGRYRAPPVRRVHIPKEDGTTRLIGIPTFEDKVLQRAIAMVIGEIYEQEFYDFSYGFRPGRSAHQALQAIQNTSCRMKGGWIVEVDIRKFFDTVDHAHLREILCRRIGDGVLLRLIGKWLNAGVLERLVLSHPDEGTPQGGVISPLLANIYLHAVLDEWFVRDVQPVLSRKAAMVRYADDCAPRRRGKETAGSNGSSFAAREMRDGPSGSDCRIWAQTTGCCSGPMIGVVSETEKAGPTRQVCTVKTNASEPLLKCRKRRDVHRNRAPVVGSGQAREEPVDCSRGDRHEDGVIMVQAFVRNVGTFRLDAKERTPSGGPVRSRVSMRGEGTDGLVVATLFGNADRAKEPNFLADGTGQPAMGGAGA